jgi:formate hydrogenlyase subunit 3/multisubunit Na+/H+ antiporter MnhD subunit
VTGLLAAGLLVLLAAAAIAARVPRAGAAAAAAGAALLGGLGFACAGGWSHARLSLGSWLGFGPSALVVDRLSGLFLALVGATFAAVALTWARRPPARATAVVGALLMLAMAATLGADQAFVFLLAWECVTVLLYLMVGTGRDVRAGLAAYATGVAGKVGGAALLGAFGLLYGATGSFAFADWARAAPAMDGDVRNAAFVLLLIGFGSKVGLVPLQGPLPLGYAAAPGAASAAMSVALNLGFYGLWRLVAGGLGPGPLWWGEVALVAGAVGALTGILYALAQDDIKRFLGFSSVEHAGIVLIGFGVALIGQAADRPYLAAAGLVAATLHAIMHAIAKALAFLGADRVAVATGQRAMEPLGGLARPLPRTATGMGIAVLSLAAIPPLAGFVSEWFTLQALLQGFRLQSTGARLVMALGGAALALTAGLGLLAFAKLFGTVFLGRARSVLESVREVAADAGFAGLGALALALGVLAPWEIRWIGRGLEGVLGFDAAPSTISHPLVLGPVYPDFSVLAPTWLAIALGGFAAIALVVARAFRAPVRRAPAWVSGTLVDPALVQYTPAAYSNPVRVVLAGPLGFRRRLVAAPDADARGAPGLALRSQVVAPFESYLYRPAAAAALRLADRARRLQSGRLSAYLLYALVVLVVVLALIPTLHG